MLFRPPFMAVAGAVARAGLMVSRNARAETQGQGQLPSAYEYGVQNIVCTYAHMQGMVG